MENQEVQGRMMNRRGGWGSGPRMEKLERQRMPEQMGRVELRFQGCWRSRSDWRTQRGSEKIKKNKN